MKDKIPFTPKENKESHTIGAEEENINRFPLNDNGDSALGDDTSRSGTEHNAESKDDTIHEIEESAQEDEPQSTENADNVNTVSTVDIDNGDNDTTGTESDADVDAYIGSYTDSDEEEVPEYARKKAEFADDDNDAIVDEMDNHGLVEQEDDVVFWEIEGLYDSKGKLLPSRVLKRTPPVMHVRSENGEFSLILTKNLTSHLNYAFESVYKAYFNVSSRGIKESRMNWGLKKTVPLLVAALAILILFIISQML